MCLPSVFDPLIENWAPPSCGTEMPKTLTKRILENYAR